MKAIVYRRYGAPRAVMSLEEMDVPAVLAGHARIKVHAVGLTPYDWRAVRGRPLLLRLHFGILQPRRSILGVDYSGTVDQIEGSGGDIKVGDRVFGVHFGSFAEYITVATEKLVTAPNGLSFEEAAACSSSALTALQCLRDYGKVKPKGHILINGASGGLGTLAVQIAKWLGAEVTAICSGRNVDLVRSLGADHTIDYTVQDMWSISERYDVVLDAVGNGTINGFRRLLNQGGIYIAAAGPLSRLLWIKIAGGPNAVTMLGRPNKADLILLRSLAEQKIIRPVLDRIYPFEQAPDAVAYMEAARARGKVIVSVSPETMRPTAA